MLEDIGQKADIFYTLIAGENEHALELAQNIFDMKLTLPLTYVIFPVYKLIKQKVNYSIASSHEIHKRYLDCNRNMEFIPDFDEKKMLGYMTSLCLNLGKTAGCSIWTNENILAEHVESIPFLYRIQRILIMPVRKYIKLPFIPKTGETIQSWFLFDLYALTETDLYNLLRAVNNLALEHERKFLYALLQSNNPLLSYIKKSGQRIFTFPYYFLAKGRILPNKTDNIYIDIRDL